MNFPRNKYTLIKILCFLLFISISNLQAAPSYDPSAPEIISNLNNSTTSASFSDSENTDGGGDHARYFSFTAGSNGNLSITINKKAVDQTVHMGTNCSDDTLITDDGKNNDPFSRTFGITSGQQYCIWVKEDNGQNDLEFDISFEFSLPATIEFEQLSYEVYEDVNIAHGSTSLLELKLVLSESIAQDLEVTYSTTDGTAIGGNDYVTYTNYTTIVHAGETEVSVFIDIFHDIPIEFDENFFVEIDSISITDGSVMIGTKNPTEVTISEQVNMPVCYEDDFGTELDEYWRTLYSSGGFTPQIVDGRLRLTDGQTNLATAVTKDYEFKSSENIIIVEFEQFAYGGCGASHGGSGTYGADGIVAVLYDSAVGSEPTPGAFGGSMGYAQKSGQDGFEGGWLGLGIDEYGNFANPTEGRIGGIGFTPNYVSIRGDGSGTSGYEFLAASSELSPTVAVKNTDTASPGHKYRMTADARDPNHLYITLERDTGSGYQVIINQFDAKDGANGQSTTPDFVRFAFTSGTGSGCNNHEIDELKVSGVCRAYDPGAPEVSATHADIVNNFTDSATYNFGTKFITTKVANKSETITGVHLNDSGDASTFSSIDPNLMFRIIPYISDSTCSTKEKIYDTDGNPAVISISNGQVTSDIDVVMPQYASKDSRFYITSLDFSEIYENSTVNAVCLRNSSTDGNLQGVAQCLNSESTYLGIFGQETYDRCFANNGNPCESQNGGRSCGQEIHTSGGSLTEQQKTDCGYNPLYGDDYGCLMCTLDSGDSGCSSDNFAIRPDRFDINITDPNTPAHLPDLMRSGSKYMATLAAYDYDTSGHVDVQTYNYNQTKDNLTLSESIVNSADGTATSLNGTASISNDSTFEILNGISADGGNNDVVGVEFDDVGMVTLRFSDKNWAKVDLEDNRSTNDPSSTLYANCNEDGAWVCGDLNVTFIPHHFAIKDINVSNNNGQPGTFSYLANIDQGDVSTYNMGARIQTTIAAENENNITTLNFDSSAAKYENPIGVTISFSNATYGDANTTVIPNALLGFTNGEYTIAWNENDTSRMLRFNFPRDVNNAVNPFTVSASDLNISTSSYYTQTTPVADANITGQDIGTGDGSATFIYGRTNAPRRVFTGPSGNLFIYFEAYCFGTDSYGEACQKSRLPNGVDSNSTNDPRWFINTLHTENEGVVGNITQKNVTRVTTTNPPTFGAPTQVTLTYDEQSGYPYKATMENNASSWLIYNKYDPNDDDNEFEVEFISGNSDWAGVDDANSTSQTDGSTKTNRRIMW